MCVCVCVCVCVCLFILFFLVLFVCCESLQLLDCRLSLTPSACHRSRFSNNTGFFGAINTCASVFVTMDDVHFTNNAAQLEGGSIRAL